MAPLSIRFADLDDINTIGFLAQQIWPPTYGQILRKEQLDYMLHLFYSPASLRRQMTEEKQQFILLEEGDEAIGFAAWSPAAEAETFKLNKLYVLTDHHGKGRGKALLQFVLDDVRSQGGRILRLNVNRYNNARQFYERQGFRVIREEDVPIGNGYYMNDFVMEATLPPAP